MEEKKTAKQVRLDSVQNKKEPMNAENKFSYEELNNICIQLQQQNQYMHKQMQEMNLTNMFKRLDYLFLVLKYESVIKNPEFVSSCIDEIIQAMTVNSGDSEEEEK